PWRAGIGMRSERRAGFGSRLGALWSGDVPRSSPHVQTPLPFGRHGDGDLPKGARACPLARHEADRVLLAEIGGDLRRRGRNLLRGPRQLSAAARVLAETLERIGVFVFLFGGAQESNRVDDAVGL